jgi:ribose 1,5-bisphosphate isomerase
MQFEKAVDNIKSLKIQGAESIARESVLALKHIVHRSKAHSAKDLLAELSYAKKVLIEARPTEPCMRNALTFVLNGVNKHDMAVLSAELESRIKHVISYFDSAEKACAEIGARKIKDDMIVFTHCHSSTVMMILAKAKFAGVRFEVHNTETRPMLQGRTTATELAALGIKVSHYVDSAVRLAMKKSDIFLFGADAIQSDGKIINKIGTELFLEIAQRYDIPSYCCAVSWKFDPLTLYGVDEPIENRRKEEVWKSPPKNVTIMNPAFEVIDPSLVTGTISELGIYRPEVFVDEVRRAHPWMF